MHRDHIRFAVLFEKCLYFAIKKMSCKVLRPILRQCLSSTRSDCKQFRKISATLKANEDQQVRLYDGHVPTTSAQKLMLFIGASTISLLDPYRDGCIKVLLFLKLSLMNICKLFDLDLVAVSGETSGIVALQLLYKRMEANEEGAEILRQRPTIDGRSPDPDYLMSLPENTLGHQYISFMRRFQISSDTRKPVKFVDNVELAYLMRRYRETHDLVHLLCRMRPNMLGEVVVKWVEALQTQLPMCYGAAIGGALRLSRPQRQLYQSAYLSYALNCGHSAKLLLTCHFEKRWEQDLNDLRAELRIPAATHSTML